MNNHQTWVSKTFQIINCSQGTGYQRQLNPYYKQPDLGNAVSASRAVFSTTKLVFVIIHFLSLNDLSDSLWLIWAQSACLPPVFAPSLLRDSLWTALSKTLCSSPHRESSQEKHICNCQASFWYSETSGWTFWNFYLSRTDVDHLAIKIKICGSLFPPQHKKYREGFHSRFYSRK